MLPFEGRSPCGSVDRNRVFRRKRPNRPVSLPVRERGSKLGKGIGAIAGAYVAPRAGAWIETPSCARAGRPSPRRSPCGSVDRNLARCEKKLISRRVAPRAGAWIETARRRLKAYARKPSLPVRERGLKLIKPIQLIASAGRRSPCGSVDRNLRSGSTLPITALSLPVRERGSKQRPRADYRGDLAVAPRAGAWIETLRAGPHPRAPRVAPRAGAWIETRIPFRASSNIASLPVRERGSKQRHLRLKAVRIRVAPRAGAWIETSAAVQLALCRPVAPRAGAWIETINCRVLSARMPVAPRAGAWIETHDVTHVLTRSPVAPRAGAWIETRPWPPS